MEFGQSATLAGVIIFDDTNNRYFRLYKKAFEKIEQMTDVSWTGEKVPKLYKELLTNFDLGGHALTFEKELYKIIHEGSLESFTHSSVEYLIRPKIAAGVMIYIVKTKSLLTLTDKYFKKNSWSSPFKYCDWKVLDQANPIHYDLVKAYEAGHLSFTIGDRTIELIQSLEVHSTRVEDVQSASPGGSATTEVPDRLVITDAAMNAAGQVAMALATAIQTMGPGKSSEEALKVLINIGKGASWQIKSDRGFWEKK